MDLNDAAHFARVVELGSFTKAAAALGLPKSSVSRSVARLEGDLGVRLLQRTTRRLGLTDAGQAFFERVRGAISGLDEAASAVQELGGEPRGVVRLTAPPDAYTIGLPEALAEFHEKYPQIHVELGLTSRTVDMVAEGFDIAVRGGRLADSTLIARKIGTSDARLFASPRYLERRGAPKTLADLATHDAVMYRAKNGRITWHLTGPDGDVSVEVKGPMSADEMSFVARAAAAGLGVALLPITVAHRFYDDGELLPVLTDYRVTGAVLSVVLPSTIYLPARVALLRDHLVAHLTRVHADMERSCARAKKLPRKGKTGSDG